MRVVSVVGARPQFIKAALLSREFAKRGIDEWLVHTGQHYDARMSDVFFEELGLPQPRYQLGVGSASHGVQTGEMMARLEPVIEEAQTDCVLVYGDTNSTLAGALVAAKMHVPVVHVESGLRSFDRTMPEEINRLVADRVADLLLAPTTWSAMQLEREGIDRPVEVVGDLMVDLALEVAARLPAEPEVLRRFTLTPGAFALATIHRASNTDDPAVFASLIEGLRNVGLPVVFPVHPRTRPLVTSLAVGVNDGIIVCEPLSYSDMLALQLHARVILTDSGGIQKEAVTLGTPCVTLRTTTEWTETLEDGWNVLVGSDSKLIASAARGPIPSRHRNPYGEGNCARRIVDAMLVHLNVADRAQTCASSF
ncbi:MAG: UDP-N-acetylglucosamine 2-epimerase (non-hydrolyzing) [Candidatus Eremiobacteraeota bacterium]|nr:UDP-N-acetylglucosamine 2-epimerase (non-hydrolyzing) [Candidatus Eremiobacteraeota bacterium]